MEQQKKAHALVKKEYLLPFILVTSLFFMWGFARAILDVLNKHFQEAMGISLAHSAMIQVMFYLGYFIMAIPAGLFIARNGYRKGVVFGLLLFGIGSLLFIPGEYYMSFNFFLFSLFVIACGLVVVELDEAEVFHVTNGADPAANGECLSVKCGGVGIDAGNFLMFH